MNRPPAVSGHATDIIRAVCRERRDSDLRADNREIQERLNSSFAALQHSFHRAQEESDTERTRRILAENECARLRNVIADIVSTIGFTDMSVDEVEAARAKVLAYRFPNEATK